VGQQALHFGNLTRVHTNRVLQHSKMRRVCLCVWCVRAITRRKC
jgi:hypothetical protein